MQMNRPRNISVSRCIKMRGENSFNEWPANHKVPHHTIYAQRKYALRAQWAWLIYSRFNTTDCHNGDDTHNIYIFHIRKNFVFCFQIETPFLTFDLIHGMNSTLGYWQKTFRKIPLFSAALLVDQMYLIKYIAASTNGHLTFNAIWFLL